MTSTICLPLTIVMAAFYALLSYSSVHAGSVLILLAGIAGGGSSPIHFRFFPLIPPNILSHPDEEHRGKAVEGFWTVIFLTNIGYGYLGRDIHYGASPSRRVANRPSGAVN